MAWTPPRDWTTADLVTAAIMNTHVRDNLDYLASVLGFDGTTMNVTLSGTTLMSGVVNATSRVGLGRSNDSANIAVQVGAPSGLTGTSQHAIQVATTFPAAATAAITGIHVALTGGAALTDAYGIQINNHTGTITNKYGVYVASITGGGTLNYAIYTNSGLVRFGDTLNATAGVNVGSATGATTGQLRTSASIYVNETANANQTLGLTINQGSADNQAFAVKSSDVAHGFTALFTTFNTEADTYGLMKKAQATSGGLQIIGLKSSGGNPGFALDLEGGLDGAADTTKTTGGIGVIYLSAYIQSGGTASAVGADGNLMTLSNVSTTRFIWDAEGSFHADVEATTFDRYDDLALLNAMDMAFARRAGDPVTAEFGDWLREHREILQRERIANFYDPTGRRVMLNLSRLPMLHTGAIRQLGRRQDDLAHLVAAQAAEIARLHTRIALLEAA